MRLIAAILACAVGTLSAGAARADDGELALQGAALSRPLDLDAFAGTSLTDFNGLFADARTTRYEPGQGLMRWTYGEIASFSGEGMPYVDRVRLSTAALDLRPGLSLLRPGAAETGSPQSVDLTYVRNWPSAVRLNAGRLSFDITPHAGLGVSSGGGRSAEAGALVRLGAQLQDRMMQAVGLRGPGEHPRWFLFAGATGRAVGLNLLRSEDVIRRNGLRGEGFVRQAQAGLGMSKGPVHALLGYTHERVSMRSLGDQARNDNRVGLTLSIR